MNSDTGKRQEIAESMAFRDDKRVPRVQSPQSVCAAEKDSLSRSMSPISITLHNDIRNQLWSGMSCRSCGRKDDERSRLGQQGLTRTNIGLPISHKSWLVLDGWGLIERQRIQCLESCLPRLGGISSRRGCCDHTASTSSCRSSTA